MQVGDLCRDGRKGRRFFDVAILDMNLNRNDSHAVADALAARGIPFVYSTGNTRHGSRDGYSDRPVLKKPFK